MMVGGNAERGEHKDSNGLFVLSRKERMKVIKSEGWKNIGPSPHRNKVLIKWVESKAG